MTKPDRLSQQTACDKNHTREEEQLARVQAQKEHNDKSTLRVTLGGTAVAVIAALAALWSGYEAHKTRIEDERPFRAIDFKLIEGPPRAPLPFETPPFDISIVAFGKTPAENVSLRCSFDNSVDEPIKWDASIYHIRSNYPYILPGRSELTAVYHSTPVHQRNCRGRSPTYFSVSLPMKMKHIETI
jgi:hypothetical protein